MNTSTLQQLHEAKNFYQSSFPDAKPESVIILGSGLGPVADEHSIMHKIAFSDLPYFSSPSIEGHNGELS